MASGMFINLVPLFALASGCLFLGETLQMSEVLGGLLVISGVVIAMRGRQLTGRPRS
jgi:drug/metabolite transporter (DMT)-like permease